MQHVARLGLDVVFSDQGALSFGDQAHILPECARVLRIGGLLAGCANSSLYLTDFHGGRVLRLGVLLTGRRGCSPIRRRAHTIQVLPAPEDLPFPHVKQAMLIERYVTDLHGNPVSAVAALGVASPAPEQASAADLAWHVREQWAIESLHWLRDTLCQEGRSQVRSEPGPNRESWLLCVTWPSAPCACSGAPMSPK